MNVTNFVVLSVLGLFFRCVQSSTFQCQMVPFKTKEGLSGHCCMMPSSSDTILFPQDEIEMEMAYVKKKKGQTEMPSITTEISDLEKESQTDHHKDDFDNMESSTNHGVLENKKKLTNKNKVSNTESNTMPVISFKNVTEASNNTTQVPDLNNRNIVDVPKRCPEGQMLDMNGDCITSFE